VLNFMREYKPGKMLDHGGKLFNASQKFSIPVNEWLDLSTGINSESWPIGKIPASLFCRLPEEDDSLLPAAQSYYGVTNCLPIAGSQTAIQHLPHMRPSCNVAVISPGYEEHAFCWHYAGHKVYLISSEEIESILSNIDVLVIINPNNPTTERFSENQLCHWYDQLHKKKGWLIVDEAFMDITPDASVLKLSSNPGFIVLRSLGKFFGLAGIRVGFIFSDPAFLTKFSKGIGPWSISNPSRYIAIQALQDRAWQSKARNKLNKNAWKLFQLLNQANLSPHGRSDYFHWVVNKNSEEIFTHLAHQGILVRLFKEPLSLRFGLPSNKLEFERLENSLKHIKYLEKETSIA